MYYYAYIDANNICTGVYQMPSALTGVAGYIEITQEQYTSQSVVGMRWNATTSTWETPMYYYAQLNENDIVTDIVASETEIVDAYFIAIDSEDQSLIGKRYDRDTQTFVDVQFADLAVLSTDEINVGTSNDCLTNVLANKANAADVYSKTEADAKFALIGSTGSGSGTAGADGQDGEDGGFYTPSVAADGTLSWTASKDGMPAVTSVNIKGEQGVQGIQGVPGTPGANGQDGAPGADGQDGAPGANGVTFTPSVSADGTLSWTNDGGLTNPAPVNIKGEKGDAGDAATIDAYTKTEVDTKLSGKADTSHSHDYAPTTHNHSTSDIIGLTVALNGKADSGHTHSNYASSTHTHSNYFSTSGGTITGETNFSGGLVRLKGIQTLFNSGSMITLSSNNVQTMIAGSAIYSKVTISVSSDERLKENIAPVDAQACIDFIKGLDVKTFNYRGNKTPCVGVIAQQLGVLSPELAKRLVTKDGDGMLGVKTSDLVFPLIVAVQALSARVAELEK